MVSLSKEELFEYDQVVIGSGFGGSVSALRMTEKGYRVLVIEQGKRWQGKDFPKTNFNLKKYLWLPRLGLTGTWKITFTRKLIALHGSGLGGGSLIYSNTLGIPEQKIFDLPQWVNVRDNWYSVLLPFYGLAQRMLGVSKNHYEGPADEMLKAVAVQTGRSDSYSTVDVAALQEYQLSSSVGPDPYFSGEGPPRKACNLCSGCMIGCQFDSKNTLDKNYLYFAERNGAEIRTQTEVISIRPLPGDNQELDGSGGYELVLKESTGLLRKQYTVRTRGVVMSGGAIGSLKLLMKSKYQLGYLANISDCLGAGIRCNSETFYSIELGPKGRADKQDITPGMSVTSMFKPDDITMIEPVRFNKGSDAMYLGFNIVPLTEKGKLPRVLKLLGNCIRHPISTLKLLNPFGKTKNSVLLMIMQSADGFVHAKYQRAWTRLFQKGTTFVQNPDDPKLTTYFPIGQKIARKYAEQSNGIAGNTLLDIIADLPVTGHIMGGAAVGTSALDGVVSDQGKVFGYQNLRILDASTIPGNLAVNPSLTILAMSEYAMSFLPETDNLKSTTVGSINFSEPLPGSASQLTETGDLLKEAINLSRKADHQSA